MAQALCSKPNMTNVCSCRSSFFLIRAACFRTDQVAVFSRYRPKWLKQITNTVTVIQHAHQQPFNPMCCTNCYCCTLLYKPMLDIVPCLANACTDVFTTCRSSSTNATLIN